MYLQKTHPDRRALRAIQPPERKKTKARLTYIVKIIDLVPCIAAIPKPETPLCMSPANVQSIHRQLCV